MTLFKQPQLWWDKLGFAQFHAVQSFNFSIHFYLEQRFKLLKKIKFGADGRRVDNKLLLLNAWREFLRRATSWPPPFFIILVTLAEVAVALVCDQHPAIQSASHHWLAGWLLAFTLLHFLWCWLFVFSRGHCFAFNCLHSSVYLYFLTFSCIDWITGDFPGSTKQTQTHLFLASSYSFLFSQPLVIFFSAATHPKAFFLWYFLHS